MAASDSHPQTTTEQEQQEQGEMQKKGDPRFLSCFFGGGDKTALPSATYASTEPFSVQGTFDCKVVRVYDGDTFWAAIQSPLDGVKVSRVCCRLLGVDTPEMPPSHAEAMTEESRRAFRARDRLVALLTDVDMSDALDGNRTFQDASGTPLPSYSDADLQDKLDAENRLVLRRALHLTHGTDKYGRFLVRVDAVDGRDVSDVMVAEGVAAPFMVDRT